MGAKAARRRTIIKMIKNQSKGDLVTNENFTAEK